MWKHDSMEMSNETKNYGYILDKIKPEDYIYGSLNFSADLLQPDGQWDLFLPESEIQRTENYDTYNCTGFGTLNCLEFLFKRLFGETRNWSERYVGIAAGTDPALGGNSPHKVIETIRKDCGLLDDYVLPMDKANTIEEYYSPDPIPWLMKMNGRKFIDEYEIKHDWIFGQFRIHNKKEVMKDALRFSPLGMAVYAWAKDGLYIRPEGKEDNHWVVIYGFEEGKYWKCFDSYDNTIKFLDWEYEFFAGKRYRIAKASHKSFWRIIINYVLELFK